MPTTSIKISLLLILLCSSLKLAAAPYATLVEEFVDAYNQRDLQGMKNRVTPNMQWMFSGKEDISVATSGREALEAELKKDFASGRGTQSEISNLTVNGASVSALEKATWQHKGQKRSQCALAVYEFEGELIRRITYFESAKCP